jgi:hypothetical protein
MTAKTSASRPEQHWWSSALCAPASAAICAIEARLMFCREKTATVLAIRFARFAWNPRGAG